MGKIHGGQNRIEDPVGKRPVYGKKTHVIYQIIMNKPPLERSEIHRIGIIK